MAASAVSKGLTSSFPIHRVEGVSSAVPPEDIATPTNFLNVTIGVFAMLIIGVFIGVVVSNKTKKATGITWFPDGFLSTNK